MASEAAFGSVRDQGWSSVLRGTFRPALLFALPDRIICPTAGFVKSILSKSDDGFQGSHRHPYPPHHCGRDRRSGRRVDQLDCPRSAGPVQLRLPLTTRELAARACAASAGEDCGVERIRSSGGGELNPVRGPPLLQFAFGFRKGPVYRIILCWRRGWFSYSKRRSVLQSGV